MSTTVVHQPDADLDLQFERNVDLPRELIWRAWTTPHLVKQWFTPAPWQTTDCEMDLRPGGMFRTVMRSPEGQEFPNKGCFLEIVQNEKLVWTNALAPGYRPVIMPAGCPGDSFAFTAVISLLPRGAGTHYRATVIHAERESRERHAAMGFQEGWGAALDQLIALMKRNPD